MLPCIFSLSLCTLYLINTVNIVVVRKGNEGRRLLWSMTMINGTMFSKNSAAIGMRNGMLR